MPTFASTVVSLDRDRTLRFDYDAVEWLSGLPLIRRGNRSPIELWQAANGLDLEAMAIMVWAGARHEERDLTIDHVRKALRQALKMRRTTYRQLNDALNNAMNQSDVLGLFNPTDDEAEAGDTPSADPPRPTAAAGATE